MSSVKKIAKNEFEILTEDHEFYLRKENNKYAIDIFDAQIKDREKAYEDTIEFPTSKAAKIFLNDDYDVPNDVLEKIIFE